MNQGSKVVLGLLAIGGIGALVFMTGESTAHASSGGAPPVKPPVIPPFPGTLPLTPAGGVVMVPDLPAPSSPPFGSRPPIVAPPLSNVPVPGGGSFNPATGVATLPNGQQVSLPANPFGGNSAPSLPPTQVLPGLVITPGPAPSPASPPASSAEQRTTAAADTIATVSAMLAREHSPHWRILPEPTLKAWQAARGLLSDGAFGTQTALRMAQEIGTLPIIRGWPKGTNKQGHWLPDYQAALRKLAAGAAEPRRSQLLAAAAREQGQGFGTPETPIHSLITLQEA